MTLHVSGPLDWTLFDPLDFCPNHRLVPEWCPGRFQYPRLLLLLLFVLFVILVFQLMVV